MIDHCIAQIDTVDLNHTLQMRIELNVAPFDAHHVSASPCVITIWNIAPTHHLARAVQSKTRRWGVTYLCSLAVP
eukprot:365732-Chlamydomonas_euryale.AAC.5